MKIRVDIFAAGLIHFLGYKHGLVLIRNKGPTETITLKSLVPVRTPFVAALNDLY